jgi:hypothetical protein
MIGERAYASHVPAMPRRKALAMRDEMKIPKAERSRRGKVAGFEQGFSDDELGHHLVLWPARVPAGSLRKSTRKPPARKTRERKLRK